MSPTGRYLPRSKWANPYNKAFRDGLMTREESLDRYLLHVLTSAELVESLPGLEGPKVLACWCAPEPCHGHVLAQLVARYSPTA